MRKTLHTPQLPSYLTVELVYGDVPTTTTLNGNVYTRDEEGRTVHCEVTSTIHVNKVVRLPFSWTEAYIRAQPNRIMGEIIHTIVRMYGLTLEPLRYS